MPAIYTSLSPQVFDALRIDARRNRRTPQDQAAILIEQALGIHPSRSGKNSPQATATVKTQGTREI